MTNDITPREVVDSVCSRMKYLATPITKEGTGSELLVYDKGVYIQGASLARSQAAQYLGDKISLDRINEVIGLMREKTKISHTVLNRNALAEINVYNGVLNWNTGELRPHSPDDYSTFQISAHFNSQIKSDIVDNFLRSVFPQDAVELAEEILGYLMIPDMSMQVAVLLVGKGANGKSTFLKVATNLLGECNVSNIPLQSLAEDRFMAAGLFGKLANIYADLPSREFFDSSLFKCLVGGDRIIAQRKFGHPFEFQPFARLLFSCNEVPKSKDKSDAYFRRWIIVPFDNQFPPEKADPDMVRKLTSPDARSAWLNHALAGLQRLKIRGYFSNPESVKQAKDDYRLLCDSSLAFLKDKTERLDGSTTKKQFLFDQYRQWCEGEGIKRPDNQRTFNAAVRSLEYTENTATREWKGMVYHETL